MQYITYIKTERVHELLGSLPWDEIFELANHSYEIREMISRIGYLSDDFFENHPEYIGLLFSYMSGSQKLKFIDREHKTNFLPYYLELEDRKINLPVNEQYGKEWLYDQMQQYLDDIVPEHSLKKTTHLGAFGYYFNRGVKHVLKSPLFSVEEKEEYAKAYNFYFNKAAS